MERGPINYFSKWSRRWWLAWPRIIKCALWDRWNVLRIPSLTPTYHDARHVMLHANMAILVRFVEDESDNVDWTWCESHAHARAEMMAVYHWWTVERDEAVRVDTESWSRWSDETDPLLKRELFSESCALSDAIEARDNDMLRRLIEIREYLWT